ncbi:MAG: hypothetical protein LBS54_09385 [Dysgonamonadaceae bacterium]|jgi:hypothetical protein|nr:hypothetical protein [Dysgonamonadaceae bacterium]
MKGPRVHIISFNIPYPADYGGVIDVFYRIKTLSELGVRIVLHCFSTERLPAKELEKYCERIYCYPRMTGFLSQLSLIPYITFSRRSGRLLKNLLADDSPILFEGLHCCHLLGHRKLRNRLKLVRMHNIEHFYYGGLAGSTKQWSDRLYFSIETLRLKFFEKVLQSADFILSLSTSELDYFTQKYGAEKSVYVPLFIPRFTDLEDDAPRVQEADYVLYHGDLSTPENGRAALFLLENVASVDPAIKWVFAGKRPSGNFLSVASRYENVEVVADPDDGEMEKLIRSAAVHVLYSNQVSGVKVKLIHALQSDGHCIVNELLVKGSGLEVICRVVGNSAGDIFTAVEECLKLSLSTDELARRKDFLEKIYCNRENGLRIVKFFDGAYRR